MKRILVALALLTWAASGAEAGPNAGGTLVIHNPSVVYSDGTDYCGANGGILASCEEAIRRIDLDGGFNSPMVWKLYAAFRTAPRLKAATFGVDYDETQLFLVASGMCGDFEIADSEWPAPGTGTGMTWTEAQETLLVEIYWFAGYSYYNYATQFCAVGHPTQGGNFADDSVPAISDPIAAYSCLGVNMDGVLECPEADQEGACCYPSGECVITWPDQCDGAFYGGPCDPNPCPPPEDGACCAPDGTCTITGPSECEGEFYGGPCEPNPCPVPTLQSTWGRIKAGYR